MRYKEFLEIMNRYYGSDLFDEEAKPVKKDVIEKITLAFVNDEEENADLLFDNSGNNKFWEHVYTGIEKLPITIARYLRVHLDATAAGFNLPMLSDCIQDELIEDFQSYGIEIDKSDIESGLESTLATILDNLISGVSDVSVGEVRVENGQLRARGRIIKLNPQLADDVDSNDEALYVSALLEVYSIEEGKAETISYSDLGKLEPFHVEQVKMNRRFYFDAEYKFNQLRDTFVDGELEFKKFKSEILDAIDPLINKKYKRGCKRMDEVLSYVITPIAFSSPLSKKEYGVNVSEKKGMVHILVNERKVEWVKDYDEDF